MQKIILTKKRYSAWQVYDILRDISKRNDLDFDIETEFSRSAQKKGRENRRKDLRVGR